jgi:hypothetical protein
LLLSPYRNRQDLFNLTAAIAAVGEGNEEGVREVEDGEFSVLGRTNVLKDQLEGTEALGNMGAGAAMVDVAVEGPHEDLVP